MKKLSCVLLLAGLAGVTGGCNKTASTEPTTTRTSALEQGNREAKSVELQARRNIDDFAAEADAAVRKAGTHIKKEAGKHADDLSAFAASIAEDAKDRALDIPEAVDQALERHTQRWHENRRRREEQSSARD
jgi:hypothetical protein